MSQNCPHCRTHNPAEAQFCHNCGSRLSGANPSFSPSFGARPEMAAAGIGAMPMGSGPFVGQPPSAQSGAYFPAASGLSKLAVTSLILAISSLFCFGFLTGVPAAILGWMELSAIKQGRSDRSNAWMAHIGLWGGIAISVLSFIVMLIFLALLLASGGMNDPYLYQYDGTYGYY
jgi:hypothetical protein